jgi:hypothetical protein
MSYNPAMDDLSIAPFRRGPMPVAINFKNSDFSGVPDFCKAPKNELYKLSISYKDGTFGSMNL